MLLPQFDPADMPELTAAEIEAMAATVARVKLVQPQNFKIPMARLRM